MKLLSIIKSAKFINWSSAVKHLRYISTSHPVCASHEKSYSRGSTDTPLIRMTCGEVLDQAVEKTPDKMLCHVHQHDVSKTYAQAKENANDLAAGLLSLGLRKGDNIAILSQNSYEFVVAQMAASKARLILAAISPTSTPSEIEYYLNKIQCKLLIYNDIFKGRNAYETLQKVLPNFTDSKPGELKSDKAPNLRTLVQISVQPKPGTYLLNDLYTSGQGSDAKRTLDEVAKRYDPDDPAMILFTSGTTGKPKAVQLSHYNTVNNARTEAIRSNLHEEGHIICSPLPFFHSYGAVMSNILVPSFNQTMVIPSDWFDPKMVLEAIDKYSCTVIYGTPTMHQEVVKEYKRGNYNINSLTSLYTGGTVCQPSLIKLLKKELNLNEVKVGYGCTETSPLATISDCIELDSCPHSVGKVMPNTEVKLVDEVGEMVNVGETGEILVRGYLVMLGYYNDLEATRKVITDSGWYKTGDLGSFSKEGYLSVVGRIKDMIIRGGENVYPTEIEHFLLMHPDIIEAQVFGVEDEKFGEEVSAWIHLKPGTKLSEGDVRKFCKGQISGHKIPKYISFVEEFPKNLIGKVQKNVMSEIMRTELSKQ